MSKSFHHHWLQPHEDYDAESYMCGDFGLAHRES